MDIDWLNDATKRWREQTGQGRTPHALLVTGSPGVGKRAFATWLAADRFDRAAAGEAPDHDRQPPEHPDLYWLRPPADKQTIGVDQVRELAQELALTSYSGGAKMAVIEPANAMTHSAANGLLKTLEEPAGDTLLLLIADRAGGLPATIVSRCQRLAMGVPERAGAIAWLQRAGGADDWEALLDIAGGGPLAALEARERLEESRSMMSEFERVASGSASPIDVAARWAKLELGFVFDWLARTVQGTIRRAFAIEGTFPTPSESVFGRIDRRNLFCYLDMIIGLRSQAAGSYNPQLALESLLIDWANGLRQCRPGPRLGDRLP